jgi:GMP synthase (glutamine-hydrolysing)
MSHGDRVVELPPDFILCASTPNAPAVAFESELRKVWGIQFHPEVHHTVHGGEVLRNFLYRICGAHGDWRMADYCDEAVAAVRRQVGDGAVICGLSGGVDSSVVAALLQRAVPGRFTAVFVDNGLLRKGEAQQVVHQLGDELGIPIHLADARERFLEALAGVTDPEQKRRIIGHTFIDVFKEEAHRLKGAAFLAQGTLYPDVIESARSRGRRRQHQAAPQRRRPARGAGLRADRAAADLFKDEVRQLGASSACRTRSSAPPVPRPGPGGARAGRITPSAWRVLREADEIFLDEIAAGWYRKVSQAFAVLLPVSRRRHGRRARLLRKRGRGPRIGGTGRHDFMTADFSRPHCPHEVLGRSPAASSTKFRPRRQPRRLRHLQQTPRHDRMGVTARHRAAQPGRRGAAGAAARDAVLRGRGGAALHGPDAAPAGGSRARGDDRRHRRVGELLGVEPFLGRSFHRDEERQGMGSGAALVSHGTWQGLLGGDPHILGRQLRLGDRAFTVVGVMPPGFAFPYEAQVWVPLRPEVDAVGPWGFFIPARLAPGVGLASANRELAALAARRPDLDGRVLTAVPLREVLLGRGRGTALVLLGAVGFLLLLVCANLANLFLVRTLGRRRELAVRAALGATSGRLARQLFAESLLVSSLAAALASLLAAAAAPLARGLLPDDLHRLGGVPVFDGRLLAFTMLVAVACAVGCGLLPGLRARRTSGLAHAGRSEPRSGRLRGFWWAPRSRSPWCWWPARCCWRRDLVRRQGLDLGYDPDDLLTFAVSLAEQPSPGARAATLDRLVTAVATLPGVQESGATCIFPSRRGNYVASTLVEGEPEDAPQLVNHRLVSPGFLTNAAGAAARWAAADRRRRRRRAARRGGERLPGPAALAGRERDRQAHPRGGGGPGGALAHRGGRGR